MRLTVAAVLLTLTACAAGSAAPEAAPSTAEALAFSIEDVRGGQVEGAEFAGEHVALWFWAPW